MTRADLSAQDRERDRERERQQERGRWAAIAVEPKADLLEAFDRHGGAGKPRVGQVPVCYDPDRDAAVARAHERFRWFGGGWKVNAELPGPAAFADASQFVRPEDVVDSSPAATTSTRSSRPSAPMQTPGSPRSRSSRSAGSSNARSSTGPRRSCCRRCANSRND